MTIIQAQPLKTYGIAGSASATDNEIPVFDGTTGKKVKGSGVVITDYSKHEDGTAQGQMAFLGYRCWEVG